jgi:uncharacterized membrane protein
MLLARLSVGWLVFFINHISHAISVNYIVDRIAGEAEQVIDDLMPFPRIRAYDPARSPPALEAPFVTVLAPLSGYIRFVDTQQLLALAKMARLQVQVLRRVGHFVPAGVPLLVASRADRLNEETRGALLATFDIGPARTLQQDVEFGVLQIVDIALRAISPAVNDPSTAITCLDQIGRILIRWVSRDAPSQMLFDPPHVLRVIMPWIDLDGLLDTAFEQIRHYAESDLAVNLRLLRVLGDVAATTGDPYIHARLVACAERVVEGCRGRSDDAALVRLHERVEAVRATAPDTA